MLMERTVFLDRSTPSRSANAQARPLRARLSELVRILWRTICPWDPGDIPELEALDAPPRRPPATPRHRFGRRDPVNELEENAVDCAANAKALVLTPAAVAQSALLKQR